MDLIKNLAEIKKDDVKIAGGKGSSLGEMINAGISVPEGFVILSKTFEEYTKNNNISKKIEKIIKEVIPDNVNSIEKASEKIQSIILNTPISKEMSNIIMSEFDKLNAKFVAVRSSATSEDSAEAAWAGQLETYLYATKNDLLQNIQKCWASLYSSRAIFYRFKQNLEKSKISMGVVIQKMIDGEKSGIAFSVHPLSKNRNHIIIEAGLGLGEAIVSGQVNPDNYVVDKKTLSLVEKNISEQQKGLFRGDGKETELKSLGNLGKKQKMSKSEIVNLAKLIITIEAHYNFPVDIEWAQYKGAFYILQSRPITTLAK